jgi:hypothetical protein
VEKINMAEQQITKPILDRIVDAVSGNDDPWKDSYQTEARDHALTKAKHKMEKKEEKKAKKKAAVKKLESKPKPKKKAIDTGKTVIKGDVPERGKPLTDEDKENNTKAVNQLLQALAGEKKAVEKTDQAAKKAAKAPQVQKVVMSLTGQDEELPGFMPEVGPQEKDAKPPVDQFSPEYGKEVGASQNVPVPSPDEGAVMGRNQMAKRRQEAAEAAPSAPLGPLPGFNLATGESNPGQFDESFGNQNVPMPTPEEAQAMAEAMKAKEAETGESSGIDWDAVLNNKYLWGALAGLAAPAIGYAAGGYEGMLHGALGTAKGVSAYGDLLAKDAENDAAMKLAEAKKVANQKNAKNIGDRFSVARYDEKGNVAEYMYEIGPDGNPRPLLDENGNHMLGTRMEEARLRGGMSAEQAQIKKRGDVQKAWIDNEAKQNEYIGREIGAGGYWYNIKRNGDWINTGIKALKKDTEWKPPAPPKPTPGTKGVPPKRPTEAAFAAYNFSTQMKSANADMDRLRRENKGYDVTSMKHAGYRILPDLAGAIIPEEAKLHLAAEADFINGLLRRETGAAVSRQEWTRYAKYLPQPGDSEKVLAMKAKQRAAKAKTIGMQGAGVKEWHDYQSGATSQPKKQPSIKLRKNPQTGKNFVVGERFKAKGVILIVTKIENGRMYYERAK